MDSITRVITHSIDYEKNKNLTTIRGIRMMFTSNMIQTNSELLLSTKSSQSFHAALPALIIRFKADKKHATVTEKSWNVNTFTIYTSRRRKLVRSSEVHLYF